MTETSDVKSPKVLVVDDDPDILNLCRTVLDKAGFTTMIARDAPEAIKICRDFRGLLDLLLVDILLPTGELRVPSQEGGTIVHGHDLMRTVVRLRPRSRILFMSACPIRELHDYGVDTNGHPFIQKPFRPDQLIHTVRTVLDGPPSSMQRCK